jgi:hypothetical protein
MVMIQDFYIHDFTSSSPVGITATTPVVATGVK